jgi:hypothetical protein
MVKEGLHEKHVLGRHSIFAFPMSETGFQYAARVELDDSHTEHSIQEGFTPMLTKHPSIYHFSFLMDRELLLTTSHHWASSQKYKGLVSTLGQN